MKSIYIIDAFAQIFRAYFAIRGGMRSPVTGEPTHAVFGIAAMLFKLLAQYEAEYVIVALDSPGKTFRDEIFADYKGTRNTTPDDLIAQIPRILELFELFGLTVIGVPGLEADDVIACITHQVLTDDACSGIQVRMVSKDKDLEQLICDRAFLFDIHTDSTIDMAGLFANKGITPEQVIDYLTLTGDTADNVPGVEGIGPKTASQLLQQYDTLDGIYANIEDIKGKRRENLEKALAHLPLSKQLVTLKKDADVGFTLEKSRVRTLRLAEMLEMFQQLGFNRYQEDARKLAGTGDREEGREKREERTNAEIPHSDTLDQTPNTEHLTPNTDHPRPNTLLPTPDTQHLTPSYKMIATLAELHELVKTLSGQPMVSFDTETTGLEKDAKLVGISLAWQPGEGVYIPVRSPEPVRHLDERTVLETLRPILEDPDIPKCGHNLKFDALVLLRHGVRLRGVRFDSMLAATLLDPSRGSAKLDNLALSILGHQMIPISELIGEVKTEQSTMDTVPLDLISKYAAEDADIALQLCQALQPKLEEQGMSALVSEVESPLATVIAEMENCGILCDPDELLRQGDALGSRVEELKLEIREAAGFDFDINSTKQLAEALFDKLGMKVVKKTKTGRSTDVEVLDKLAALEDRAVPSSAVPRLILEYRQLQKLISTYLGNLRESINPTSKRIHSTFHQLVAATGRLASQNPNLQNIPVRSEIGRQIRKAFYAPAGHSLICADYSQVELRVLAHFSGDPALIDAFAKELDIHTAVASEVFNIPLASVTREQRNQAKTINFGIIYGVTAFGLARRVEGLDVGSATRLIADYKQKYAGIDAFLGQCIEEALTKGYVTTILGRRRSIPEITSTNQHTRSLGERLAINSVIQGSAADLIKMAMVKTQNHIDGKHRPVRMLLQIHDELIFETPTENAPEEAALIKDVMENAMELRVPLRVDCGIGLNWMEAK